MGQIIIGCQGRARHGKTIVCEAIYRKAIGEGFSAKLYDIGDMIRRHAVTTGRLPAALKREEMTTDQIQILINVGREQREVDVNFWVKQMMSAILADKVDVALCPNARFETEAKALRGIGGVMVRCTRLNDNGSEFISPDRPPNDVSEIAFYPVVPDFYLTTVNGQIPFMERQAVALYEYLKETRQ